MFTVKTFLGKSKINGLGSMADEFIPKGTIIWKFVENFDIKINDQEFKELPEIAQEFFLHFAYYNKEEGGYILCGDNARYTNHSSDPNMKTLDLTSSIATKDIQKDEEITEDYYNFDEFAKMKLGN